MKKSFKKIWSLDSVIVFTLFFLGTLITNLVKLKTEDVIINVQQIVPKRSAEVFPVLKPYTEVSIKADQILVLKENHLFLKFIAPKNEFFMDNLYAIALSICGLVIIYFFWNYNKENPFAGRLSRCMFHLGEILLLTWVLNCLRLILVNKQVYSLTNHEYMYGLRFFELPEFWVSFLLFRLAYVMKKGEKLQLEQDLTV